MSSLCIASMEAQPLLIHSWQLHARKKAVCNADFVKHVEMNGAAADWNSEFHWLRLLLWCCGTVKKDRGFGKQ